MTGWDFLDRFMYAFPPIAATVLFVATLALFLIGFSRHGLNFLKYGFKQNEIGSLGAKISEVNIKIDGLRSEFRTDLATIKTNHFGHLKGFLAELTSILLDKDILNNTDKARLDNQLRDM